MLVSRWSNPRSSSTFRLFLALCLAGLFANPVSSKSATGNLAGRVVGKESSQPVPMGWVVATSISPSAAGSPGLGARIQNDGSFRIHNVPPGPYVLTAHAPGYRNSDESEESTERRAVEALADGTQRVRGGAGGSEIVLRLERMGTISGTVTDESGIPVDQAKVSVFAVSRDGSRTRRGRGGDTATTDDRGQYRISGLGAGTYLVRAMRTGTNLLINVEDHTIAGAPRTVGAVIENTFHPSASNPDEASVVSLAAGEDRFGVDIQYPSVRGYPITGIVLNPDGSPAPRAHIQVIQGNRRHPYAIWSTNAMSGEDGRFSTSILAPGSYLLETTQSRAPMGGPPGTSLYASAEVELSGSPAGAVTLQLREQMRIHGTLSAPNVSAASAGPGTGSAPPARISLFVDESATSKRPGFGGMLGARFNDPQHFFIPSVRPNTYRLEVQLANPAFYVSEATLAGQNLLTSAVTIDGTGDQVPMRIVIKDGAATIRGKVPVPEGAGVHTCFLRLYPAIDRSGSSPNLKQVYCGEDGAFEVTGVAPGRYRVFPFTMEELAEADLEALAAERWDRAPTITVAEREEKEVQLEWP